MFGRHDHLDSVYSHISHHFAVLYLAAISRLGHWITCLVLLVGHGWVLGFGLLGGEFFPSV